MISIVDGQCNGLVAVETSSGSASWTLVSALAQLLHDAEKRFGPRDMTWTPVGVEFGFKDKPGVWYPVGKTVSIILGKSARTDTRRALFQLAHETIHLLDPIGSADPARTIEEGVAVLFSDEMSQANNWVWHTSEGDYLAAKDLVLRLLKIDPDAIRKLRSREPFHRMTAGLITQMVPNCPLVLAEQLCLPF